MSLTAREKWFIGIGAVYLLLLVAYFFFSWYQERKEEWERMYLKTLEERRKIEEIGKKYLLLKKLQVPFSQRDLLTEIENLLQQNGLKEYTNSILPSERDIEEKKYRKRSLQIHFKPLPIDKLLVFIENLERNYPSFQIERLQIRKHYQKKGFYYVSLRIAQFSRK